MSSRARCSAPTGDRHGRTGPTVPGVGALTGIGDVVTDPTLAPEVNLRRRVLAGISLQSAVAAIGWGALYVAFGEPIAGLIPWTYAAVSFASLAFARTRYAWYVRTQLALILVLPFLLQLVLGGFVPGSAVMVWHSSRRSGPSWCRRRASRGVCWPDSSRSSSWPRS